MGPKGAIEVLHQKELQLTDDPVERIKFVRDREEEYRKKFAAPFVAAKYGYIDDVIEPRNTRFRIIRALQSLATYLSQINRTHSNLSLIKRET